MELREYVLDSMEEEGVWRTIKGQKVFIRKGETPVEALFRKLEYVNAQSKKAKPVSQRSKEIKAFEEAQMEVLKIRKSPKAGILKKAEELPISFTKTPQTAEEWKERAKTLARQLSRCMQTGGRSYKDMYGQKWNPLTPKYAKKSVKCQVKIDDHMEPCLIWDESLRQYKVLLTVLDKFVWVPKKTVQVLDMEVNDSFMDLVQWVMETLHVDDEEEAKVIAWKIIAKKRRQARERQEREEREGEQRQAQTEAQTREREAQQRLKDAIKQGIEGAIRAMDAGRLDDAKLILTGAKNAAMQLTDEDSRQAVLETLHYMNEEIESRLAEDRRAVEREEEEEERERQILREREREEAERSQREEAQRRQAETRRLRQQHLAERARRIEAEQQREEEERREQEERERQRQERLRREPVYIDDAEKQLGYIPENINRGDLASVRRNLDTALWNIEKIVTDSTRAELMAQWRDLSAQYETALEERRRAQQEERRNQVEAQMAEHVNKLEEALQKKHPKKAHDAYYAMEAAVGNLSWGERDAYNGRMAEWREKTISLMEKHIERHESRLAKKEAQRLKTSWGFGLEERIPWTTKFVGKDRYGNTHTNPETVSFDKLSKWSFIVEHPQYPGIRIGEASFTKQTWTDPRTGVTHTVAHLDLLEVNNRFQRMGVATTLAAGSILPWQKKQNVIITGMACPIHRGQYPKSLQNWRRTPLLRQAYTRNNYKKLINMYASFGGTPYVNERGNWEKLYMVSIPRKKEREIKQRYPGIKTLAETYPNPYLALQNRGDAVVRPKPMPLPISMDALVVVDGHILYMDENDTVFKIFAKLRITEGDLILKEYPAYPPQKRSIFKRVGDSFQDLVNWVMAKLGVTDEDEARAIAWKIIQGKRKKESREQQEERERRERQERTRLRREQWEREQAQQREEEGRTIQQEEASAQEIMNKTKAGFDELKEKYEAAADPDKMENLMEKIVRLRNQYQTDYNQESFPISQLDKAKELAKEMDEWMHQRTAELDWVRADYKGEQEYREKNEKVLNFWKKEAKDTEKHIKAEEERLKEMKQDLKTLRSQGLGNNNRAKGLITLQKTIKQAQKDRKDYLTRLKLSIELELPGNFDIFSPKFRIDGEGREDWEKIAKEHRKVIKNTKKFYDKLPGRFKGSNAYKIAFARTVNHHPTITGHRSASGVAAGYAKLIVMSGKYHRLGEKPLGGSVLVHEVGHQAHADLWGTYVSFGTPKWKSIYRNLKPSLESSGDSYAKENSKELFAEAFMAYLTGGVWFERRYHNLQRIQNPNNPRYAHLPKIPPGTNAKKWTILDDYPKLKKYFETHYGRQARKGGYRRG